MTEPLPPPTTAELDGVPASEGARTAHPARPRNRRALILRAAADLFTDHGYDRVSVGDIAAAVGIGPSALYRHFSGKQDLLQAVLAQVIAPMDELVAALGEPETALRRIASVALDERHFGVLWQREARHLSGPGRSTTMDGLRRAYRGMTQRVRHARPELDEQAARLLASTLLSILISPSFHRADLPRPEFDELLAQLTTIALRTAMPTTLPAPAPPSTSGDLMPASRREALLAAAMRMFAEHGYSAISTEDIAAAVGIAGPSIYNHFPSKAAILDAAIRRGSEVLFSQLATIFRISATPEDALRKLVRSYVTFTAGNHHVVGLLIMESRHLPDAERDRHRQAQHDYIDEWVHLLLKAHPAMTPTVARIRVHAVLGVANDLARVGRVRDNPAALTVLADVGTRLLNLPPGRVGGSADVRHERQAGRPSATPEAP